MDFQELLKQYKPFLKQHYLPMALGLLGFILLAYGLLSMLGSSSSPADVVFDAGSEDASESAQTMLVDVSGAVVAPGVYRLTADARIHDALIAASGLSFEADREWIAKNLNLAAKLTDGAKVYVPRQGEVRSGSLASPAGKVGGVSSGFININTASEGELESLPGIGPVTAKKIVENRPYAAVDDLFTKKIVGSKVFSQIKDKITVY